MNYPIDFSFKLLALASQIRINDANGQMLGYVKQKLFKLKEDIRVYTDDSQTNQIFGIRADRILDFSAKYNFTDRAGSLLGSIRRRGMRSLWKAHYEIYDERENQVMEIREEKGWVKVVDSLVGEVPVVGMFSGYLFNPAYLISRADGTIVARMQKQPAFFEGKFQLTQHAPMNQSEETRLLLSVLTMTLLERARG
ncbi:MAG TPA: hypothetical protein VK400_08535 [Pyrinomonadaceae bacterium]|nr:hypothetical protein [Pyrinomonadaceae bacterium]